MAKTTKYDDTMPDKVIAFMEKGCLPCELAAKLSVRKEDILSWLRDTRKAEFRNAFKLGMAASEGYWARLALEALTTSLGKTFKERLYTYVMESQFGWCKGGNEADKVEKEDVMSDSDLDAKIEALIGGSMNIVPIVEQTKNKQKRAA